MSSEALAKEDWSRHPTTTGCRIRHPPPKAADDGYHGRKPVGLHLLSLDFVLGACYRILISMPREGFFRKIRGPERSRRTTMISLTLLNKFFGKKFKICLQILFNRVLKKYIHYSLHS